MRDRAVLWSMDSNVALKSHFCAGYMFLLFLWFLFGDFFLPCDDLINGREYSCMATHSMAIQHGRIWICVFMSTMGSHPQLQFLLLTPFSASWRLVPCKLKCCRFLLMGVLEELIVPCISWTTQLNMQVWTFVRSYFCCRDGRIKVIGGDGIEGLFISPKPLPIKHLEVCLLLMKCRLSLLLVMLSLCIWRGNGICWWTSQKKFSILIFRFSAYYMRRLMCSTF